MAVANARAIGERIAELRRRRQWSQRDLARQIGAISHNTIALLERGHVDDPRISTLQRLADALSVDVGEILGLRSITTAREARAWRIGLLLDRFLIEDAEQVLERFADLSADQQAAVVRVIELMHVQARYERGRSREPDTARSASA